LDFLDGSTGNVYGEKLPTVEPEMTGDFATLMQWADEIRTLKIRTNADTPADAIQARKFGAEGIDFAVRSICSSILTEFRHERNDSCKNRRTEKKGFG